MSNQYFDFVEAYFEEAKESGTVSFTADEFEKLLISIQIHIGIQFLDALKKEILDPLEKEIDESKKEFHSS